jgi:hypothetical protein
VPALKPARNPSRSTPAPSSSAPVMAARVDAAIRARAGSPWDAVATAAAVRADSVEVVLTDSGREVPARAYTSVGTVATYRSTWTGSPAMVAYAMAWG